MNPHIRLRVTVQTYPHFYQKAENITEDTVLLNYLMNSKPRCIAKFVSSAVTRRGVLTAVWPILVSRVYS